MKELSDGKLYVTYWSKSKPPFDPNKIEIVLGDAKYSINKPQTAFWGSPIDADWGWKEWCKAEEFGDYDWDNPIYFRLKSNSVILKIDIFDLREEVLGEYISKNDFMPRYLSNLDFNKIVEDGIDAVELMDGRIGHLFLNNDYEFMFNSWDCESIVILNKDVIEFVNSEENR